MKGTLLEFSLAIWTIYQSDDDGYRGQHDGIQYQTVYGWNDDAIGHHQFAYRLKDADIGKGRHSLMSYDSSVVRNAYKIDYERK